MGPIEEHLVYVSDAVRLAAYRRAVLATVRPGARVADLGCGTGILGLLCLQAGASAVFEIDATPMIDVARESMTRAGLQGSTTWFRAPSSRVELPQPVDLVICDQVGNFGFDARIVHDLADARRRFLKPGGTIIPRRIRLYVAGVEAPALYDRADAWGREPVPEPFRWVRGRAVNTTYPVRLSAEQILLRPVVLGDLDLYTEEDRVHSWRVTLRASRAGILHGLAGWFECELADGIWMSNSPLATAPINRSQAFLPIGEPIGICEGDVASATIVARPADDLLAWSVTGPGGVRQRQSTWQGALLTREDVIRAGGGHVPTPNARGRARTLVLAYCDGRRTVDEVTAAVLRDHPRLFPTTDEIASFVTRVLAKDTD